MLALWHWHIEISSKCTLRCPRCTRQEVPEGLVNKELRLPFFRKNFTPEFINEHVEKITFCGDDGDPIYLLFTHLITMRDSLTGNIGIGGLCTGKMVPH